MVSVVVFVVPVAFVHLPALLVVVVMGVAPIGAWRRVPGHRESTRSGLRGRPSSLPVQTKPSPGMAGTRDLPHSATVLAYRQGYPAAVKPVVAVGKPRKRDVIDV